MTIRFTLAVTILLGAATLQAASDWPQWQGARAVNHPAHAIVLS